MADIAASPVVNPGTGCNLFRIVLRVNYKKDGGSPDSFFTHKQYLLKGDEKDIISYSDGNYFVVFGDSKDALQRGFQDFIKRSLLATQEWTLASKDDFERFMNAIKV